MAWTKEQKKLDLKKTGKDTTKFSTWTPLNDKTTNDKVFEERSDLVGRWYDKWSDSQRRKVLGDLMERSTKYQLGYVQKITLEKIPKAHLDFTKDVPRCISLYIFSFLDPRSLCRCSKVSWYWKYLTELDQIWMPKALKLGWKLTFSPSPFETGVWKRHYLENVRGLSYIKTSIQKSPNYRELAGSAMTDNSARSRQTENVLTKKPPKSRPTARGKGSGGNLEQPPWKASSTEVKDTIRFNYLDNEEEMTKARKKKLKELQQLQRHGSESDIRGNEDSNQRKATTLTSYRLKKVRSASNVTPEDKNRRPDWARQNASDAKADYDYNGSLDMNKLNLRPDPIQNPPTILRPRSGREPAPATQPFRDQPWNTPNYDILDDEY